MLSNTKITKDQKNHLAFVTENKLFEFFDNEKVTVCFVPAFGGSKMAKVSVSIMSDNEKKYRRKVGQYFAMMRMLDEVYISVPISFNIYDFMDSIATF